MEEAKSSLPQPIQTSDLQIEAVELISSTLPIFVESAKRKFRELEDI
jgi:hypothetical protein